MSRSPRRRHPSATPDAGWATVGVSVDDDGHTYRVLWSAECHMYRGLCDTYPALSWQAATEGDALDGIRSQVHRQT